MVDILCSMTYCFTLVLLGVPSRQPGLTGFSSPLEASFTHTLMPSTGVIRSFGAIKPQ